MEDEAKKTSPGEQIFRGLLSLFLIVYGAHGVIANDIFLPAKHRGLHFHGSPAVCIFIAMFFAVVALIAPVICAHDHRDNDKNYKLCTRVAICLLFSSLSCLSF